MDIEQIKKLNEMTKTLQKHGIAVNAEDGSRMAGETAKIRLPAAENSAISKDYVELLFERNNRKISQEISLLKEKVDLLEKGISELREKNTRNSERILIRDAATGEPVHVNGEQSKLSNSRRITKEDVKNGNDPDAFSKSDVAVENVFYYGNKH